VRQSSAWYKSGVLIEQVRWPTIESIMISRRMIGTLALFAQVTYSSSLRKPIRRPRLECQNLCHIHCKNNFYYITNCAGSSKSTSWGCLSGCAVACDNRDDNIHDGDKYEHCRDTCGINFQLRCDVAGCKAGCRRGSTHEYQFSDNSDDIDEQVNDSSELGEVTPSQVEKEAKNTKENVEVEKIVMKDAKEIAGG
jgi:hypothetical protein